ncbi:MAG: GNAT family N-acetyltransferase [Anaerolineales bacterium]
MSAPDLSRAAALIAESFREEGFTRNTLDLSTPAQQARFTEAVELRLLLSRARGEEFVVATIGETLVGIAIVKPPAPEALPWYRQAGIVLRRVPRLLGLLKDAYLGRIVQFIPTAKLSVPLPQPYYTLDVLAVAPDHQGQGIARQLVEHVHAQCDEDEQASGCYLLTGDEKNTQIYRRFGYRVVEAKQGGPVTAWHMFRPHPARDAEALFAALREAAPATSPARWRKLALPILGMVGALLGLALLWRRLHSREPLMGLQWRFWRRATSRN